MRTDVDRPDVLDALASMRPDAEAVDRSWTHGRRQAALQRALTTDASKQRGRSGGHPSSSTTKRWIGAGLAAAAVSAAVLLLVPPAPVLKAVPASPAATATPAPAPARTNAPEPTPAGIPVSTAGWKTFSSPEYPITFLYPADWTVSFATYTPTVAKADELTKAGIVDGCAIDLCAAYVSPPGQAVEGGHALVLARAGFRGGSLGRPLYDGGIVVAAVPDLLVWTSGKETFASTAAIVKRSADGFCVRGCTPGEDFGAPYGYMLSTSGLVEELAVGSSNPLDRQPEASFTFGSNWGLTGHEPEAVMTILASSRPNPHFAPTQPEKGKAGR